MSKKRNKKERQEMFSQSRYSEINSLDSLKLFLEEERNQYTEACLYYIKRDKEIQKKLPVEKHHIIPCHEGGPDDEWNLVEISNKEHMDLHHLRFEAYQNHLDLLALRFRKEPMNEQQLKAQMEEMKKHRESMKQRQVGFYSGEVQSELGKRRKRHTQKREIHYVKKVSKNKTVLFKKTLKFIFLNNQLEIIAPPGTFSRTGAIIKPFLLHSMPENCSYAESIKQDKYFTTNINKVLNKFIDGMPKESQRSFYKGWTLEILD